MYSEQLNSFIEDRNFKFKAVKIEPSKNPWNAGFEGSNMDHYKCSVSILPKDRKPCRLESSERIRKEVFYFTQGEAFEGVKPTLPKLLGALRMDYNMGSDFNDFCDEYGFDNDSIRAAKVWENVIDLTGRLNHLLGNDIEEFLQLEIED